MTAQPAQPSITPTSDPTLKTPLVRVENLVKHFPVGGGLFGRAVVHAVDGVDLAIAAGETLGLVGESGCGKSTLGRVIVRLQPATSGHVYFEDIDLTKVRGEKLRRTRQRIQMIFQDPYASLNPRMTVGDIVSEPLRNFGVAKGRKAEQKVQEVMRVVGLNPNFVNRYPHEFSGGQRQRIGIARALAVDPSFIVCDEPVSALDVSIQAQILNLLEQLQDRLHLTYLFIAHDLSVVKHISDRIAVMYVGKVVEVSVAKELYAHPQHPYTGSLLSAIPIPDPSVERGRRRIILQGDVVSPVNPPSGCRFRTRCFKAQPRCAESEPPLDTVRLGDHRAACFFPLG